MELKSLALASSELKFSGEKTRVFSGYASVFGGVDSYGDTIVAGAYKDTISNRERPIQLRWNHYGPVIGKWTRIEEDERGLLVEGELTPGHSVAEDAFALLKHGSVNGLSIGYRIPEGGAEVKDGIRYLSQVDLVEISVVESPADIAATIGDVKSAIESVESMKEFETFLRDVGGFSRANAKVLVSHFKSLYQRDVDTKEALTETVTADQIKQFFKHYAT